MHITHEPPRDDLRPRLIVWQLTLSTNDDPENIEPIPSTRVLSFQECSLIIDSIARTAKPILVLRGKGILRRSDMRDIVEYGLALGLKVIVEAEPEELSEEIIRNYSSFGPKIFRIQLDGGIVEDMDTRFRQSKEFLTLEQSVKRMKEAGYEIHFAAEITNTSIRELAFKHDYAVRKGAKGVYCHFFFGDFHPENDTEDYHEDTVDSFIESIATMKYVSPKNMYFSPQCVKYGIREYSDFTEEDFSDSLRQNFSNWTHWCLAGKSFAFINPEGVVQFCAGIPLPCGDLRANGYNFKEIWEHSEIFERIRQMKLSCSQIQIELNQPDIYTMKKYTDENEAEKI